MIVAKEEPVPKSLLEISNDLKNLSSSGTEIYVETENFVFQPILAEDSFGVKNYSYDFIANYGSPSVYHPVCCAIKKSV